MRTPCLTLAAIILCAAVAPAFGQELILYRDGRRNPETDPPIDMWIHSWMDSPVSTGHGGFVEQAYLTPGDPMDPPKPGAVLKYIKAYNHGILAGNCKTQPTTHEKEQAFFFVLDGVGVVECGGVSEVISEGTGVFIPARMEYRFTNTSPVPLQVVIIVEDIPDDFEPLREMKVGSYHDHVGSAGGHWCHVGRGIVDGCRFYNPIGMAVVSIESFDIAHPHAHVEGCEEVWTQIEGDSLLFFGKHLRHQPVGTSFLIPPDGETAHSSINHTGEPMKWLYMGNRMDLRMKGQR